MCDAKIDLKQYETTIWYDIFSQNLLITNNVNHHFHVPERGLQVIPEFCNEKKKICMIQILKQNIIKSKKLLQLKKILY